MSTRRTIIFARVSSLIRFSVGFVFVATASILFAIVALVLLPWRLARIRLCNLYGHIVGRAFAFFAGATTIVRHRERLAASMPAIYVANHTSDLDAFLCVWLCPYGVCGVFKKEIVRVPFYGWLAALSGHLLLDRGNLGRAVESLRETASFVRRNRLGIWIMPEGTYGEAGELLPFKKGFVHLAIATGLRVVPVVLKGAHESWKTGTLRLMPATIEIDVLPAIETSDWREDRAGEHAAAVRAVFAEALAAGGATSP
ncbi:MAG: lysophospholipid acyltransferase family protein [Polyangiales bacterium]